MMPMDKDNLPNVTVTTDVLPTGMRLCREWYALPAGSAALVRLQGSVRQMVADIFGYHALEIGALAGQGRFLAESRIAHQVVMGAAALDGVGMLGATEHLPFAANNIDLVVASHVLDCTCQPHQVLREIERVLVPEGHLILIGFNPFSLKGIGQLRHWFSPAGAQCHYYPLFRVRDWLSLLGFEVITACAPHFCTPSAGHTHPKHAGWGQWLGALHLLTGSVYVIHAKKKVSNMTPLLTSRKVKAVLRPGMAVNPSAGRVVDQDTQHGH